jgi:hypothetical protein
LQVSRRGPKTAELLISLTGLSSQNNAAIATSSRRARQGNIEARKGQSMTFLFDFGDAWRCDVKLEGIEPLGKGRKLPTIVEKHGNSPEQYPEAEW